MNPLLIIVASACAASVAFTSCQTTAAPAHGAEFAKTDLNHDGKLSHEEASDYFVDIMFTNADANHDGSLTWEEWQVPGAGQSKAKFKAADSDKDGNLTLAEARAYGRSSGLFKQNFRSADANHDGFVTQPEAQAYYGGVEGPPR
jgi:Ca2+-binding EF-hand superfamily protein